MLEMFLEPFGNEYFGSGLHGLPSRHIPRQWYFPLLSLSAHMYHLR
jgi:hypothetical protein